ncbi:hypothetical protein [Candidatus Williamhamiltonella defendens]|nr:hypothetical protein [Candidatus Hamiltonella defensa]
MLTVIGIDLAIEKKTAVLRGISLSLRAYNLQQLHPSVIGLFVNP